MAGITRVAGWIVVGVLALLIVTGGVAIYRSVQYGYVFRANSSNGKRQLHCYVQSTHSMRRYGPILIERNESPFFIVIEAYDRTSGSPVKVQCLGVHVWSEASRGWTIIDQPLLSCPPGESRIRIPIDIAYPDSVTVECRVDFGDVNQLPEQFSGTATAQPPIIRAYPYWWYVFRKLRAG